MKKLLHLSLTMLILIGFTLPLFAATTPTANDGKWYFVKSQRFNTGGPWWTFNATDKFVVPGALTKSDSQKFTVVEIGTTGKVTIKDFSGLLLTGTATTGLFDAVGATTGWTITPNMVNGVNGTAFPGENSGLHQGSGGWGWKVASGWYSLADNCTFFFYEAREDFDLHLAIDDATSRLSTTSTGTNKGQTPQSAVDAYQNAINTAKTTLGSTNSTDLQNAITALATATTTFINAKIPLVTSSTAENPVWYLIKNTTRGGKGATLFTNGLNVQMKTTSVANTVLADGSSTGAAAPTLNHLFRFEKQADATYKIINAALPEGEINQAATGGSSSSPVRYGTAAAPKWNLNLIGYNATLTVDEIKFVSTGNGTVWHADGNLNLVSWDGGSATASAWYVESYTGDLSPLYKVGLTKKIAEAENVAANVSAGSKFGQTLAANKTILNDAIVTAKNVHDNVATTPQQFIDATNVLETALATFKQTINKSYSALLSDNTSNYRWFWIKSTSSLAYSKDYVISAGVRAVGEKFTYEIASEEPGDIQLFRFELTEDQSAIAHIINKSGTYMGSDGSIRTESSAGNTFTAIQLTDGYSFNVKPSAAAALHAQQTGLQIVNWAGEAGSASAWKIEYALETPKVITGTSTPESTVVIRLVNKQIMVEGAEHFEIYSINGQKVNPQVQLESGVYVVKTNSEITKVVVK
jgi:uncharacterized membrane protein